MTKTVWPKLVSNIPLLFELSESEVYRHVRELKRLDLFQDKSLLISRLSSALMMVVPQVYWDEGEPSCRRDASSDGQQSSSRWRVSQTFRVEDPHYVLTFMEWLGSADACDHDCDSENGRLSLALTRNGVEIEEALLAFGQSLAGFRLELERVAREIERFNQALPYLLSLQISTRRDSIRSGWTMPTSPPSRHVN